MRNRKMWWKWAGKSIREGSKTYIQFLQKIPFCRLIPTFFVHLERIAPWSPCLSDFKHLSSVFCLLCCTEVANDLLNTKFNSLACLPPTEPPCCIWLCWFYPSSNSLFLILHWIHHPHGSLCLWLLLSILQFIFLFLSEEISILLLSLHFAFLSLYWLISFTKAVFTLLPPKFELLLFESLLFLNHLLAYGGVC